MSYTPIDYGTAPNDGTGDALRDAFIKVDNMLQELYNAKVDKVTGKGLSTNDFTDTLKTKLDGIEAGAEVNVQSDLAQEDDTQDDFVKNKGTLTIGSFTPQIETYAGVSTFTLPVGAKVSSVLLVRTQLWAVDEYSQTDNILTITKSMITGNRIQINFY